MRFISNGDYIFPFQFKSYLAEHTYMWSFQHGAANPDGIMRLPGRLVDLLVFAAFGNIGVAYFYLTSCLVVGFAAFFWFARSFLEVKRLSTQLAGALFFICNPIFLGNISKVGLILAATMLPVALTALKLGFAKRRFSYFLLYIVALNISLLHPFTFSLNLLAGGIYLIIMARRHSAFVRDNMHKFALLVVTALLLNAYLLLPLAALGTVDKGALSDTVNTTPVDYTSLVDIANTGDIFTGLSLSKGVLKDYEFYGARTWPFYFLGVFAFYALLFGVYVRVEKRAKPDERRRFVLSLAVFLTLLALSTATFLHADVLIKFLIGLPGGWMFRSPLKWQLYMPLAICTALVIALKYIRSRKNLTLLYAGLGTSFVLMNTYLCVQIYHRLLTPRTLTYFSELQGADLTHKNLLFVNSDACMAFARDNPGVSTELNQVFISKETQVKHVDAGAIDTVAVGQYDYVLGCQHNLDTGILTKRYAFQSAGTFARSTYALYRNTRPAGYVATTPVIYATETANGISGKDRFAQTNLSTPFHFAMAADNPNGRLPAIGLQDVFDTLSPASIHDHTLLTKLQPITSGHHSLYLLPAASERPVYYRITGDTVQASTIPSKDSKQADGAAIPLGLPSNEELTFSYDDPAFAYSNSIPNGSFEQGAWQQKVGDCNAYDNQPDITMQLDSALRTDGKQSLELTAKKHIACTGPEALPVAAGQHYLLHFDYASKGGRYAGYNVTFDDENDTSTGERMLSKNGNWTPFTTEIVAPPGAKTARLMIYAYPDSAPGKRGVAHYDNLSLTRIPDVKNRFFVTGLQQPVSAAAPTASFAVRNPTKTLIHIQSAKQPFYITTKETYHRLWQLHRNAGQHGLGGLLAGAASGPGQEHLRLDSTMNGWYIDPNVWCTQNGSGCTKLADGSYNIDVVMEFAPQRWFYLGGLMSLVAGIGALGYVSYDVWRARRGAKS